MIKFNDRFEFERDKYCWHLHDWRDGVDKDGAPKRQKDTTYHPTIQQICRTIMDRSLGGCESLTEMISLLDDTVTLLEEKYNEEVT